MENNAIYDHNRGLEHSLENADTNAMHHIGSQDNTLGGQVNEGQAFEMTQ